MIRRGVLFLILIAQSVSLTTVLFVNHSQVQAASLEPANLRAPLVDGYHMLRRGDDGDNTLIKLNVYYRSTDPMPTINIDGVFCSYDDHGAKETSKFIVKLNGNILRDFFSNGNVVDCGNGTPSFSDLSPSNPHNSDIPDGTGGFWRVADVNVSLDADRDTGHYNRQPKGGNSQGGDNWATYNFIAKIVNPNQNKWIGVESSTTSDGSYSISGPNSHQLEFGPPLNCGPTSSPLTRQVGTWDAIDGSTSRNNPPTMKLERKDLNSSSWENITKDTTAFDNVRSVGSGQGKYYEATGSNKEYSRFEYKNFESGRRYRLSVDNINGGGGQALVMIIPFSTIYGSGINTGCPASNPYRVPWFTVNDGDLISNAWWQDFNAELGTTRYTSSTPMGIRTYPNKSTSNLAAISRSDVIGFRSGQSNTLSMPNYPRSYNPVPSVSSWPSPQSCPWGNNPPSVNRSGTKYYQLSGKDVPAGYHVCVFKDGGVEINGDIGYVDSAFSLDNVHVLKIYAKSSISIDHGANEDPNGDRDRTDDIDAKVKTVNAVLVSGYKLLTCGDPEHGPEENIDNCRTSNTANPTLTINGAIATKKLRLYRNIFMSSLPIGGQNNEPKAAEIFNFTPEAWLSALSGNLSAASGYDAYTIMPPIL